MANINKIKLSGTSYDIQDSNAARSVTLTQAQYDALQTKDPNVFYIISDSSIVYMTSADTESAITQAVSGKQDTLVSGTNIKTINNQSILGSGNISIQAGGISSVEADYDDSVEPNGEFDILINDGSSYSQIFIVGDGLQVTENSGDKILSATGGGITSGEVQTMIDSSISGKTNQSDFSAHTANTTIHVTTAQTAAWNAKSDFSGSYNDLTNKLSAGTNITIVDNVISAEGGGKAIEAGRGISITTGATADTVSFDLPISSSTETLLLTDSSNSISDTNSVVVIGASNNVSSNSPSRPTVKSIILGFSNEIYSTSSQEAKREKNYIIGNNNSVKGDKNVVIGANNIGYNSTIKMARSSYIVGNSNSLNCGDAIDKENNYIFGSNNKVYNSNEVSIGYYNNSVSDGTTSGNTFFSVGNGTADNARHNAFEIRQNGDIYLSLNGQDVKLQDQLGGGGNSVVELTQAEYDALVTGGTVDPDTFYVITDAQEIDTSNYYTSAQTQSAITQAVSGKQDTLISGTNIKTINNQSLLGSGNITIQGGGGGGTSYTAGTGIDITNDVISVSGVVMSSAITTAITSSSTDAQVSSAKAVNDKLGGLSIVKLTQAQYNALSTKDSNTLYVIVN